MKKLLAIVLMGVMALSLVGCGGKSAEKTTEKATEAQDSGKQKFTVGFDAEYPPYGYMDEKGEYTGFDLELAQAVCDIEGWQLVKTPIDWDSKDMELKNGTIDCIWNGFTINGREKDYTWSDPYVNNEQVMVVAKDAGISKLSDLKGKYVGVQKGSAALDLLSKGGSQEKVAKTFGELQQFADYNTAFTEMQSGTVDAVAMDIGVAKYQIESRGDGYEILGEKLNSEQYGIGFKKGNTKLRDTVNNDLKKLATDGTVKKLAKKYGIEDMICLDGAK